MPTDALAIAPAVLAVVLLASAIGKWRAPAQSAAAFAALKVPSPLASPAVVRALPWVELVLAVGLVVAGGAWGLAVAAASVALLVAYLVLVVRARGFDAPVDCACFGSLGPSTVTRVTVWRNAWLLALGLLGVWAASNGPSLLGRVVDGQAPWWWLAAAGAAALTATLVIGPRGQEPASATDDAVGPLAELDEELDYLRVRTPAVPVTLADDTTRTLRQLSSTRPLLLVQVSDSCGGCLDVIDSIPAWRAQLPSLDLRVLVNSPPGSSPLTSMTEPLSMHDTQGYVSRSFGYDSMPSAVLLGADGLLAGGPVTGEAAIREFVREIAMQLGPAAAADAEISPGAHAQDGDATDIEARSLPNNQDAL